MGILSAAMRSSVISTCPGLCLSLIAFSMVLGCSSKPEEQKSDAKAGVAPASEEAKAATKEEGEPEEAGAEADTEGDEGQGDTTGDGGSEEPSAVDLDVKTGVDLCDDYATKWKACIAKAPTDQQPKLRKELGEHLAAWKQTVDGGGSAAAVEIGCTTALENGKAQSKDWGCTF